MKDRIRTLRQGGGLSGFTKRSESPFDAFGAGHAGTALSAKTSPLGFATAFTLQLTNGGVGAQTFPATPMGAAPTLQSAGVDVLVFVHDGTAWRYAKAGA